MAGQDPPLTAESTKFPERHRAETFAESDVTLSHDKTQVASESLALVADSTADRPNDDGASTASPEAGLVINPNTDLSKIQATVSANTVGATGIYLAQTDGTVLDSDTANTSPGDVATLEASLSAGTKYYVYADAGGSTFDRGNYGSPSFPYSSTHVDIVNGYDNGSETSSLVFCLTDVTALIESGTTTIEWPYPADVFAWGHASFQRTLAGETVRVDVQETSDGGATWSDVATNISRGADISAAAAGNNVRLKVSLSRANTANNPTLDFAARSYTQ